MARLLQTFFGFRGRIGRAQWWLGQVSVVAVALAVTWLRKGTLLPPDAGWSIADALVGVAILIPSLALTVKRLNDRDHAAWIGWAWCAGNLAATLTAPLWPAVEDLPPTVLLAFAVPAGWVLVDNGFLRGTQGPNRYGPDPLPLRGAGASPTRRAAAAVAGAAALLLVLGAAGWMWRPGGPFRLPGEIAQLRDERANAAAWQALQDGDAAARVRDGPRAIAHYTRAIALYGSDAPEAANAYRRRGNLHRDAGALQAALDDYGRAIALSGAGAAPPWHNRAGVLARLGRHEDALRDYDRALAQSPNADSQIGRAGVLAELGRDDEALAAYGRAVEEAQASFSTLKKSLEATQARDGMTDWGGNLERLRDDQLARAHAGRAALHQRRGRSDAALADLDAAIRHRPDYARAFRMRGWLHEQQGRRELARADYDRAAQLREPDAWLTRALERVK